MKYCSYCGTPNDDSSTQCRNCGTALLSEEGDYWSESPTTMIDEKMFNSSNNNGVFQQMANPYNGNSQGYNPHPQEYSSPEPFTDYPNQPVPESNPYSNNPDMNPGPKRKKKKTGLFITLGVIIALIIAGLLVYFFVLNPDKESGSKKDDKQSSVVAKDKKPDASEYKPGVYMAKYGMNVRVSPSDKAKTKEIIKSGSKVTVAEIKVDDDGNVWGKTGQDSWICMADSKKVYMTLIE